MAKKGVVVLHSDHGDRRDELSDCVIGSNVRISTHASGLEAMAGSLKVVGADQLAILARMREDLARCERLVRAKIDYERLLKEAVETTPR